MIAMIADILALIGGIWVVTKPLIYIYNSYRSGRIAHLLLKRQIRRINKMINGLEESGHIDSSPDVFKIVNKVKIGKISYGTDAEKIEAINYVRHSGPNKSIDRALKSVICTGKDSRKVKIIALEVFRARLEAE